MDKFHSMLSKLGLRGASEDDLRDGGRRSTNSTPRLGRSRIRSDNDPQRYGSLGSMEGHKIHKVRDRSWESDRIHSTTLNQSWDLEKLQPPLPQAVGLDRSWETNRQRGMELVYRSMERDKERRIHQQQSQKEQQKLLKHEKKKKKRARSKDKILEQIDTNKLSQERLERRIDELNKMLLEEKHHNRKDKLAVAKLQQEVSRQKSERSLRETLMKELEREKMLRMDAEQRLRDVTMEGENTKTRYHAEFKKMEDMAKNMGQYRQKLEILKQEKASLSVSYEQNMAKFRSHVCTLEHENTILAAEVKKLEAQCSNCQLCNKDLTYRVTKIDSTHCENNERVKILLDRLKRVEEEKSQLVLENENQRQQYEKCLDEIANQVVQALLSQKTLREECAKLQTRVRDLEDQNKQLNLMFHQRIKFTSDSVLQSLGSKKLKADSKPGSQHSDSNNSLSPNNQCLQGAAGGEYQASPFSEFSLDSLQSLCSDYNEPCQYEEDALGKPELSTPPPWLKDNMFNTGSPTSSIASSIDTATKTTNAEPIYQNYPMSHTSKDSGSPLATIVSLTTTASTTSPLATKSLTTTSGKPRASDPDIAPISSLVGTAALDSESMKLVRQVEKLKNEFSKSVAKSPFTAETKLETCFPATNESPKLQHISGPKTPLSEPSKQQNLAVGSPFRKRKGSEISPGQELLKLADSFSERFVSNGKDLERIQNNLFSDSDSDDSCDKATSHHLSMASTVSLNELLDRGLDNMKTPNDDNFSLDTFQLFDSDAEDLEPSVASRPAHHHYVNFTHFANMSKLSDVNKDGGDVHKEVSSALSDTVSQTSKQSSKSDVTVRSPARVSNVAVPDDSNTAHSTGATICSSCQTSPELDEGECTCSEQAKNDDKQQKPAYETERENYSLLNSLCKMAAPQYDAQPSFLRQRPNSLELVHIKQDYVNRYSESSESELDFDTTAEEPLLTPGGLAQIQKANTFSPIPAADNVKSQSDPDFKPDQTGPRQVSSDGDLTSATKPKVTDPHHASQEVIGSAPKKVPPPVKPKPRRERTQDSGIHVIHDNRSHSNCSNSPDSAMQHSFSSASSGSIHCSEKTPKDEGYSSNSTASMGLTQPNQEHSPPVFKPRKGQHSTSTPNSGETSLCKPSDTLHTSKQKFGSSTSLNSTSSVENSSLGRVKDIKKYWEGRNCDLKQSQESISSPSPSKQCKTEHSTVTSQPKEQSKDGTFLVSGNHGNAHACCHGYQSHKSRRNSIKIGCSHSYNPHSDNCINNRNKSCSRSLQRIRSHDPVVKTPDKILHRTLSEGRLPKGEYSKERINNILQNLQLKFLKKKPKVPNKPSKKVRDRHRPVVVTSPYLNPWQQGDVTEVRVTGEGAENGYEGSREDVRPEAVGAVDKYEVIEAPRKPQHILPLRKDLFIHHEGSDDDSPDYVKLNDNMWPVHKYCISSQSSKPGKCISSNENDHTVDPSNPMIVSFQTDQSKHRIHIMSDSAYLLHPYKGQISSCCKADDPEGRVSPASCDDLISPGNPIEESVRLLNNVGVTNGMDQLEKEYENLQNNLHKKSMERLSTNSFTCTTLHSSMYDDGTSLRNKTHDADDDEVFRSLEGDSYLRFLEEGSNLRSLDDTEITLSIENLSRTVDDLQRSLSSLNSGGSGGCGEGPGLHDSSSTLGAEDGSLEEAEEEVNEPERMRGSILNDLEMLSPSSDEGTTLPPKVTYSMQHGPQEHSPCHEPDMSDRYPEFFIPCDNREEDVAMEKFSFLNDFLTSPTSSPPRDTPGCHGDMSPYDSCHDNKSRDNQNKQPRDQNTIADDNSRESEFNENSQEISDFEQYEDFDNNHDSRSLNPASIKPESHRPNELKTDSKLGIELKSDLNLDLCMLESPEEPVNPQFDLITPPEDFQSEEGVDMMRYLLLNPPVNKRVCQLREEEGAAGVAGYNRLSSASFDSAESFGVDGLSLSDSCCNSLSDNDEATTSL